MLMLRRAPQFLRAVQAPGGAWDALDQIEDEPTPDEAIVVYEMVGQPSWMHVRARKGGGIYRGGQYRLVTPQPPEAVRRHRAQWRAWAIEEAAKRRATSAPAAAP